jgi:cysteine desulfurase
MNKSIYLDYMATTPIDPRVIARMLDYMGPDTIFGNPASTTHLYGKQAAEAVEHARLQIAEVIHASPAEIVFTSGATEADNLAILGAARFYQIKGRHIITMSTEHKAVLDCVKQLETEGFEVSRLSPESDGLLNLSQLQAALRDDTILVSIMHVNNEIGVVQDIAAIGDLLRGRGIVFHVDAAQSAGKLPIDLRQVAVDLMSFSAHKLYGPKGVGALYIRYKPRIRLQPIMLGGGHEQGLRSGTLPTHQIVGMGEAFSIAEIDREFEQMRLLQLRERLWRGIESLPGICLNGHREKRIAGNLNICFKGLEGMDILPAISELAVSTSSACTSAREENSYVLQAIGLSRMQAQSSVRISLGRYTVDADVEQAIHVIRQAIVRLQAQQEEKR